MTVSNPPMDAALSLARRFLICAGLLGTLIFSGLFALTFANQDTLKRHAEGFIKQQISHEVKQTNAALADSKYGDQLEGLKKVFAKDTARAQAYVDSNIDVLISNFMAARCGLDCDKREDFRRSIRAGLDANLRKTGTSLKTVETLIAGKYDNIVSSLRRDLRIFFGTNLIMFALVGLALVLRRRASLQLLIPATLLTVSALISISLYVFEQNWFYTLIYSSFWGYAYSVYAGVIFLCLLDIFLNKARLTSFTLNAIFSAAGSALGVASC